MDDAERIRVLMSGRNKAEFAREHKMPGGASMISQHLSGHRPVSIEAAVIYARGCAVAIEDASPAAAEFIRAAVPLLEPHDPARTQAPPLHAALQVVFDAMAKARSRQELRTLLQVLVDADSRPIRQRIGELLDDADPSRAMPPGGDQIKADEVRYVIEDLVAATSASPDEKRTAVENSLRRVGLSPSDPGRDDARRLGAVSRRGR